ncbi:transposase [Trebonia kvetii]|uniref:Transposase n=1 Tax=Trebonia kvetii TaxID=2480626 RepID=A0A6P2C040_9ACTN|nr:transposase [Trebonia kvetii]TVZ04732.1 transposase [Trebonia kvetii]
MYVKTSVRKTRTGEVRYLQLAHNEWDAARGRSVPKVIYGFGREDQLDKEAVRRLVASLSRLLDPGDLPAAAGEGLEFAESRPYGGAYVLDALWQRLGIGTILTRLASSGRGRPRDAAAAERVLFGLVANGALAPSSKLAASEWMSRDVHVDGLGEVDDDACYRAMDWLHGVRGELEKQVYFQVADLLNLQVDLIFFDTTSTYFETGAADEEVPRDWRGEKTAGQDTARGDGEEAGGDGENTAGKPGGFRAYGKSKDSRDDLPQVVIGLAVTREGIPVRVWCWPGNTAGSALIRQVKTDMRDWCLGRVVWVADRGFASKENRKFLQSGGGAYIIGEKLRSGSAEANAALSRQGRYKTVAGNLQIKEVRLPDAGDRFVICFNPDQAVRDAAVRANMISMLEELIAGSDQLSVTKRAELRGKISTMPGPNRFLRVTPGGLLRVDKARAKAEENLDGKYLLRSADPHMSAEDIAAGYKQLLEVERGWRDMKSVLDLQPVYHRLEERIRAHVLLCWLALLLVRVAENHTGQTWPAMRRDLQRISIGTFTGPAGTFRQRTEVPKTARDLLTALKIDVPRKIHELTTPEA